MTLYERYNINDDSAAAARGVWWFAQTFTIGNTGDNEAHNVTSIKLKLRREGLPGMGVVAIYTVDGEEKPDVETSAKVTYDFDDLPEAPAWVEFIFPIPAPLLPNTQYAVVIAAPLGDDSNKVWWRLDQTSPTYTGGSYVYSWDSSDTWVIDTGKDLMFEEYEASPANPLIDKPLISPDIIKKAIIR